MNHRSPEDTRGEGALDALGDLVRLGVDGAVPPNEHERGRERLLAALREKRSAARRPALWLAAAALLFALGGGLWLSFASAPLRFAVDGERGAVGGYVHAPPEGAGVTARFSDGSEIVFVAGSNGRIAEVSSRGARVLLESGRADVRVAHLPGARWSIEAGPFAIAVIGTAFDVGWSPDAQALLVRLHEGAVTVRGPLAPNGIDLRAGQRLAARVREGEIQISAEPAIGAEEATSVANTASATAAPAPPEVPPAPPTSAAATSRVAPAAAAGRASSSWPRKVATGDFRGVVADAEARGIDATLGAASLPDLVALADAARYAGRPDLARRALLAQRSRFPGAAEAHAAAFLLGRLADDADGPKAQAISWYDQYLGEAPRGAFAAEALGRKMIALLRASDPSARKVAEEYLRLYPTGPHAAAAHEIAQDR